MGDIQNKAEELTGDVKQVVGDATGDEHLQKEGLAEESNAQAEQAAENEDDAELADEEARYTLDV